MNINPSQEPSGDDRNAKPNSNTDPSSTPMAFELAKIFNGKFTVTDIQNTQSGLKFELNGQLESPRDTSGEKDELSWKDLAILQGAVRCELYLSPLEYAVIQLVKEKFFTYYAIKELQQSTNNPKNPLKKAFSTDCAELISQLSAELLGDSENIRAAINTGAAKNKKAQDKIRNKSATTAQPVNPETIDVHPLVLAIAKILESYVAGKEQLSEHAAKSITENSSLKNQLVAVTQERDHFMRCLENGSDFMNYGESNRFLHQKIIELQRKLQKESETRH